MFLTFSHVFTDPTGLVNIFADWDAGEIDFLRYHARETLAMLEDESGERFADVFLKEFDLGPAVFDEFFQYVLSSFILLFSSSLSTALISHQLDSRMIYLDAPNTLLSPLSQ